MKTIWKYAMQPDSVVNKSFPITVRVPIGSKLLYIGNQKGSIFAWVEVDSAKPDMDQLTVYCVGTGFGAVEEGLKYFTTVIQDPFVWHFYVKG